MSNYINQNKKMMGRRLITTRKIHFLFAILFAAGLNNSYAQNTWIKKADFGAGIRNGSVGFSIGNKGYLGTGAVSGVAHFKDFWEYDPSSNTWTQKADFGGTARAYATGFSIGNKGYIGTGGAGSLVRDFWEYDLVTNAWTQKVDFGGTARFLAVGFSIGSKGYIGTGSDINGGTNDFWEYDPATNAWTKKANFGGTGREGAVGFSIGGKGYIGTGSNNVQSVSYKDFWEYDPATNGWTRKADFGGVSRSRATGFSIGSKGYIGTGYTPGLKNDFWEYDPSTDTWTQKASFGGTPRYVAAGFSIGSKGYIGTGYSGIDEKDFWEYTPENTCLSPSGLKVLNVSDTCAKVKWDAAGADISYVQLRYRAAGETTWTRKRKDAAKHMLYINELTPNTTYNWQLRSLCAEDTSGWIKGPDFTTAVSLHPITDARAYPNPAKNVISVNYTAQKNSKYIFEITDISGNTLLRKEANAMLGANSITLDISRFFNGLYFINITRPDKTKEILQVRKE